MILYKLQHRFDLIRQLVITSLKQKTEGSYLALIWDIVYPLLAFLLIPFVFKDSLGANIEYYSLYVLLGVIHIAFFFQATNDSTAALLNNANLIKSINFSKESIIISSVISSYIPFILSWLAFFVLMWHYNLSFINILMFPIIIIVEFLFAWGISFIISTVTAFFRDFKRIWSLLMQIFWYVAPVFYLITDKDTLLYKIQLFNPLYHLMTLSRNVFLYNNIFYLDFILIFIFALVVFFMGYFLFSSTKRRFVELL